MTEAPIRLGLIVPSSNTTVEPDFQRVGLPGVTVHSSRTWIVDTTLEDLGTMNREAETAAYCCTSGSFLGGPGYDRDLLARVSESAGGTPTVGTSPAVVDALHSLGVHRVAAATPYVDAVNERLTAFLTGNGFEVAGMRGQQIVPKVEIGAHTPDTIHAFARASLAQGADGLFLSCTNWRAMEVVDALERELGVPVITSSRQPGERSRAPCSSPWGSRSSR